MAAFIDRETKSPKDPLYNDPEGISVNDEQEVEYERFIVNLDKPLIKRIETFISEQKNNEVKLFDVKTGKHKRINKSLWVREVLLDALNEEKQQEILRREREQKALEEFELKNSFIENDVRNHLNTGDDK